jgi:hypothetical protein
MHRQQRGVTMIGWLLLLIPVAIVGYAGIRLAPIYLNYFSVVRSMDRLAQESRSDDSAQSLRFALEKRLDIEAVTFPDSKDFTIKRDGQAWVLQVDYEDAAPLVSNVSLLAKFSKTVRLGKAASE